MSHSLPSLVTKLCYSHDAWIVGSAALADVINPRDFDVLVPFRNWQNAAQLIPEDARPNTFGGWKCISEGVEVDVWPGDLDWLLQNFKAKAAFHPRTNTRLIKE